MDAFWAPTWHDSKPNRPWGYFLWTIYAYCNTHASQWTR
jgi:hypothetical protein